LKMGLYRNLKKSDPEERGFIAMPKGLEDEFFRQLTAESRKAQKAKSGFTRYLWVKDPNQANEGLDTHLQAEAAAIRLGVRNLPDTEWDRLMSDRERPPEDVQGDFEDLLMAAKPQAEPADSAGSAEDETEAQAKERARSKWRNRTR